MTHVLITLKTLVVLGLFHFIFRIICGLIIHTFLVNFYDNSE